MSAKDYLKRYADGWTKGDPETILSAVSDEYVLDDPNEGYISKEALTLYVSKLKEVVSSLRSTNQEAQFMELSEIVSHEEGDGLTAWCWWAIPGTQMEGSGLIKVTPEGVRSERLAFYTKLTS